MFLQPVTENFSPLEDHSWLNVKQSVLSPHSCKLNGADFAAVFTDGVAKSGVVIARKTTDDGTVYLHDSAQSDGRQNAIGILYTTKTFKNRAGTTVNVPASFITTGEVYKLKLAAIRTAAQSGGPSTKAITDLKTIVFN